MEPKKQEKEVEVPTPLLVILAVVSCQAKRNPIGSETNSSDVETSHSSLLANPLSIFTSGVVDYISTR